MSRTKPFEKIKDKHLEYQGCYEEFGVTHPEYVDPKYYNTRPGSTLNLNRPDLPSGKNQTEFTNFLDGPARFMPSAEDEYSFDEDPTELEEEQALERCYNMAKRQGKQYFALQDGGYCMASNDPVFSKGKKVSDSMCRPCQPQRQCEEGTHACPNGCLPDDEQCPNAAIYSSKYCASNDTRIGKSNVVGGPLHNSVFRIKDMDSIDDPSYVTAQAKPVQDLKPVGQTDSKFTYARPEVKDKMNCPARDPKKLLEFSPGQQFLYHYFKPSSSIKGLLDDRSMGYGKTCEAMMIASRFWTEGWKVVFVGSPHLQHVWDQEVFDNVCVPKLRTWLDDGVPRATSKGTFTTRNEKLEFLRSGREEAQRTLQAMGVKFEQQRRVNYDDFLRSIMDEGIEKNTVSRKLNELQHARSSDYGYKTLFIVDEAHHLVMNEGVADQKIKSFTIQGKRYTRPQEIYGPLETRTELRGRDALAAMLYQSYETSKDDSAKILLLTGTPQQKGPTDLLWLLNILLERPDERLSMRLIDYYTSEQGFRMSAMEKVAKAARGRVAYLNLSLDPSKFARKLFARKMVELIHPQHYQLIQKHMKDILAKNPNSRTIVQAYQNLALLGTTSSNELAQDVGDRKQRYRDYLDTAKRVLRVPPQGIFKMPKRFSREQSAYKEFVFNLGNGKARMATEQEFLQTKVVKRTRQGNKGSFLMWYKTFRHDYFKSMMGIYAPKLKMLIENILEIEANNPTGPAKHFVFTFSQGEQGGRGRSLFSSYGSRIVASAFAAYGDKFHVCLEYKKGKGKKYTLDTSAIPAGKMGVALLSSKSMANQWKRSNDMGEVVEWTSNVKRATLDAVNAANNRHGERIKVLIVDGAFVEGISSEDHNIAHHLDVPISKSELDQASSRVVRNCQSTHLPFFKGVGAFVEMYFYDLLLQEGGKTLNDEMLSHIPEEELMNTNLIDAFEDVIMRNSIDFKYNVQINSFNDLFEGVVTGYQDENYEIVQKLEWHRDGQRRTLDKTFLVNPANVVQGTSWLPGTDVLDVVSGLVGRFVGAGRVQLPDGSVLDRESNKLRFPIGTKVQFHIPKGVDMATRVMNIGNVRKFDIPKLPTMEQVIREDFPLPEVSREPLKRYAFGTDDRYILMSLATLLFRTRRMVNYDVVLPPEGEYEEVPPVTTYSAQWNGQQFTNRTEIWQELFSSPDGLSFLFLVLPNHQIHLLIYTPKWHTLERFSYQGALVEDKKLDEALATKAKEFKAHFVTVSDIHPSQLRTKDKKLLQSMFTIFYMHSRILDAERALKKETKETANDYIRDHHQMVLKYFSGDDMAESLDKFAAELQAEPERIQLWTKYDDSKTFWSNLVRYLRAVIAGDAIEYRKKMVDQVGWWDWLKNGISKAIKQRLADEGLDGLKYAAQDGFNAMKREAQLVANLPPNIVESPAKDIPRPQLGSDLFADTQLSVEPNYWDKLKSWFGPKKAPVPPRSKTIQPFTPVRRPKNKRIELSPSPVEPKQRRRLRKLADIEETPPKPAVVDLISPYDDEAETPKRKPAVVDLISPYDDEAEVPKPKPAVVDLISPYDDEAETSPSPKIKRNRLRKPLPQLDSIRRDLDRLDQEWKQEESKALEQKLDMEEDGGNTERPEEEANAVRPPRRTRRKRREVTPVPLTNTRLRPRDGPVATRTRSKIKL